jgi:H+/Cl- antiporter ClcA
MKQTLIYSLKIWLTSVVLSPIFYTVYDALTRPKFIYNPRNEAEAYLYFLVFGLALSIPSWVLFWLSLHCINTQRWKPITTKLLISIVAVALTFTPFLMVYSLYDLSRDSSTIGVPICYSLLILAGVWYYKLRVVTLQDSKLTS